MPLVPDALLEELLVSGFDDPVEKLFWACRAANRVCRKLCRAAAIACAELELELDELDEDELEPADPELPLEVADWLDKSTPTLASAWAIAANSCPPGCGVLVVPDEALLEAFKSCSSEAPHCADRSELLIELMLMC